MSVSRYPADWPTEQATRALSEIFAQAGGAFEGFLWQVSKSTKEFSNSHDWPDPLPTAETVGVVWSAHDLRADIDQFTRWADELDQQLHLVDAIRRDAPREIREEALAGV